MADYMPIHIWIIPIHCYNNKASYLGGYWCFSKLEPAIPFMVCMGIWLKADLIRTPCEGIAWKLLIQAITTNIADLVVQACPCAILR